MTTSHIQDDRSARSDAEALEFVCRRLQLDIIQEILDGGSSARVWLATNAAGERFAVKTVLALEGVVDGHDLDSFRQKVTQIEAIRAKAPSLGTHYLPVLHNIEGTNWACQTTPFYPSQDQAAPLRQADGETTFFAHYDIYAQVMFLHGYGVTSVATPSDYVERVVVGRFLRRLPMLTRALPQDLAAETLVVNGRSCLAPGVLLPRLLQQSAPSLDAMVPARLGFCAHGDANTRNILIGEGADFRVIDPRGSTEAWDPIYDLAKTLFCLTVWDPALRLGFAIQRSGSATLPHYEVDFRQPLYPGYCTAIQRFLPFIAGQPWLTSLLADDPGWRARLLLTHDMHVLAEAPCRLSDRKPKWGVDGAPSSPEQLALGFYLMGTLLINELAEQFLESGSLNDEPHLSLMV